MRGFWIICWTLVCVALTAAAYEAHTAPGMRVLRDAAEHIAATESARFITALEDTVREHFRDDAAGREQFLATLWANLGLDAYTEEDENIEGLEQLRRFLNKRYGHLPGLTDHVLESVRNAARQYATQP